MVSARRQIGHAGMLCLRGAENRAGLGFAVVSGDFLHIQDGQRFACAVGERHAWLAAQARGDVRRNSQRDGQAPGQAVRQAHGAHHGCVVGARHETLERAEAADGEHLQVGELERVQAHGRQAASFTCELGRGLAHRQAIDESSSVRLVHLAFQMRRERPGFDLAGPQDVEEP
jgi:hypothetical protein